MEYFQLRGSLVNSRGVYGRTSTHQSSFAMAIILVAHALVIFWVLHDRARPRELVREQIFQLIRVMPVHVEATTEPPQLDLPGLRHVQVIVSDIQFSELISPPLNFPLNEPAYELPSESSGDYGNVFDPKMRQKLLDAKTLNRARAQENSKTWTAIDGRTYIEMGDGICMVSMAKADSRDRANNWGYTTCGKDDSEKAIDRVMADFESRKAPLGKLKSSP
jgi:hypothetical protein